MKKLAVFTFAALAMGSLYAEDPQADAATTPKPSAPPAARKPLLPLDAESAPSPQKKKFDRPSQHREVRPGHPGRGDFAHEPQGKGRPDFGPGPRGQERPKAGHGEMLAKALNLTPEQQKKARAIMEAAKPKIEAARKEGQAKVKSVMDEALKELRPSLTPEQQAVLDDLQKFRADKAALEGGGKLGKQDKTHKSK